MHNCAKLTHAPLAPLPAPQKLSFKHIPHAFCANSLKHDVVTVPESLVNSFLSQRRFELLMLCPLASSVHFAQIIKHDVVIVPEAFDESIANESIVHVAG